jgi:phage FluMu gp28-like protein
MIKPLSDTTRTIDWEELPPSVREIPDGFDPLSEGVLMKHQVEWNKVRVPIKICVKGRRTGITFATALDDAITIGSRKSAGGDNIYYIGDTKDKGLEYIGYIAKFQRVIAQAQKQGVSDIEEFLFPDQDEYGNTKYIAAYRIRTAAGYQAVALSSRPANIRGLQGKVRIDEAAFHPDVQGVLDAATALLIWGGEIVIISTHNGKNNPFNQLARDIESGLYGDDTEAKVYRVTFDDAVANGLYERVCMMKGEAATAAGKKKWYTRIRNAYGPRKAAMREELDAVPKDSSGMCIPGVWIERSMPEARPVIRLTCPDDFVDLPDDERKKWCESWIKSNMDPLYGLYDNRLRHVAGMDFARHRHFSVVAPIEITRTLRRKTPFVLEMQNTPVSQQLQIVWALFKSLPRFCGAAIDATGPGLGLAELTADHFGHSMIHQIMLNRQWYAEWMPKMTKGFEDDLYDLCRDADLEGDIRAVEYIDGIPMVPKVQRKDLKEPDLYRHGDFAIALVLGEYSAINLVAEMAYFGVPKSGGRFDTDDDTRPVKVTAGLGRGKGLW